MIRGRQLKPEDAIAYQKFIDHSKKAGTTHTSEVSKNKASLQLVRDSIKNRIIFASF